MKKGAGVSIERSESGRTSVYEYPQPFKAGGIQYYLTISYLNWILNSH